MGINTAHRTENKSVHEMWYFGHSLQTHLSETVYMYFVIEKLCRAKYLSRSPLSPSLVFSFQSVGTIKSFQPFLHQPNGNHWLHDRPGAREGLKVGRRNHGRGKNKQKEIEEREKMQLLPALVLDIISSRVQ